MDKSEYISFVVGIYTQIQAFFKEGRDYNAILKIDFVNQNRKEDHVVKQIIVWFGARDEILLNFLSKNLNPFKTILKNIWPRFYFVIMTREFCCLSKAFKQVKAY